MISQQSVELVVSQQMLDRIQDLLGDAQPGGEEFSEIVVTMNGAIYITRSNADPGLYWIKLVKDEEE